MKLSEEQVKSAPIPTHSNVSSSNETPPGRFVSFWRRVYRPMGFRKGYSFTLFAIFGSIMVGFVLSRFMLLDLDGQFKNGSLPGGWYWFREGHYRVGILMHLAAVLPMGFLCVFQFVPAIRYKFLLFHRINGYVIITLFLVSNAAVLMIARRSAGGDLSTQGGIGFLAIITTTGLAVAYYNIKVKQLDQHRIWMLRVFFWAGSIITQRIVMLIAVQCVSLIGDYYYPWSCQAVKFTFRNPTALRMLYPSCFDGEATGGYVAVHAGYHDGSPEQTGSAFRESFGMALWIALAIHAIGIEIYLRLTPRETERLRQISYDKQLEAGYKNPGSAGLVVERFGDAEPWIPPTNQTN